MANMLPTIERVPSDELLPPEEEKRDDEGAERPVDEEILSIKEEINQCYEAFDPNNSGSFDVKYLGPALKCLGIPLAPTELSDLEDALSKEGVILYHEFCDYALEKIKELDPYEALKEAFQNFDLDNEGILLTDRFKKWMTTLGNPLSEKEVKEFIKLADPAKKGVIAYYELIMILLS